MWFVVTSGRGLSINSTPAQTGFPKALRSLRYLTRVIRVIRVSTRVDPSAAQTRYSHTLLELIALSPSHSLIIMFVTRVDDVVVDCPNALELVREFTDFCISKQLIDSGAIMAMEEEQRALKDSETVRSLKASIDSIVSEYLVNGEVAVAKDSISALNAPYLGFEVVKRLVLTSFDRDNSARELASRLLGEANGSTLTSDQIAKGFTQLLERCEDRALDTPNVVSLLAFFIARAVMDEALPPAFLVYTRH